MEALVIFALVHLYTSKGNKQLLPRNYLSAAVTATLNISSSITNMGGQENIDFLQMKIIQLVGCLLLELKANISKSIITEANSRNQKAKLQYRNKAKQAPVCWFL